MLFDRPIGPWRATPAEAANDVIARRLASREPWSRTAFLSVGVWMQRSRPTPETERDIENARRALWKTGRETIEVAQTPAGRAMEERRPKAPLRGVRRWRNSRG